MINSYSKIISENSSLSKKTKQKNLISNENKNISINNNENSNEIEDNYIEKDFSINEEENIEKPLNNRKGNTIMFLYTKNLFPLILIGPHCKIIIKIIKIIIKLLLFL